MIRLARFFSVLLALLAVAACQTNPVATVSRADVASGRYAAVAGPSGGPCGQPTLAAAVDPSVPLMVQAVGPEDYARKALYLPPGWIGCGGDFLAGMVSDGTARIKQLLQCAAEHIVAPPTASLHYAVYAPAPKAAAAPYTAPPCAPPAAPARVACPPPAPTPVSRAPASPRPADEAAEPSPAVVAGDLCHDESCGLVAKR